MNWEIISKVLGLVVGVGAVISIFTFWYARGKDGGVQATDKLVATLKELITAQDQKLAELQESHAENQKRISVLEGRVTEMSKINGDLRDIIITSLNHWLAEHPEEALKIAKEIKREIA